MKPMTGGTSRRAISRTTRGAGRRSEAAPPAQPWTPPRFRHLRAGPGLGSISFTDEAGVSNSANLALVLIEEAWRTGCDFEDLADGYGRGAGTMGDWSAIRDSTIGATEQMLERALNYLFSKARG
jgi:hypothetical protein